MRLARLDTQPAICQDVPIHLVSPPASQTIDQPLRLLCHCCGRCGTDGERMTCVVLAVGDTTARQELSQFRREAVIALSDGSMGQL